MGKFSYEAEIYTGNWFPNTNLWMLLELPTKFFFLANAREGVLAIFLISCKGIGLARFIGNFQVITAITYNLGLFKNSDY